MAESGIRGVASRHGYDVASLPTSLYDLEAGPGETTYVAAQHPEIVTRLKAIAATARADLGDALTGVRGSGLRPGGDIRAMPP